MERKSFTHTLIATLLFLIEKNTMQSIVTLINLMINDARTAQFGAFSS